MQGSLDEPPIVIRGRRWTWRQPASVAVLIFIVLSRMRIHAGSLSLMAQDPMDWVLVAVGSLGLVGLGRVVLSPPVLELSPQGIRRTFGWRTWRYRWEDVINFRPIRLARVEALGFDYTDPAKAASGYRQWVRTSYGAPGVLASNMELSADELAGLLNRAREKWAGMGAPAAAKAPRPSLVPMVLGHAIRMLAGRMGRRAYWIGMAVIAAVAVVASLFPNGWINAATFALIGWLFVARGRMRDIGRSPRWVSVAPIPIAACFAVPFALGAGLVVAEGVAVVASIAAIVGLGAIPGDAGRNRFGLPPGAADERETIGSAFS